MNSARSGALQRTLTSEDEILEAIEKGSRCIAEAVRWYNYNVGAEAIHGFAFLSSDENERSKLRIQWFLNNISIPEKKTELGLAQFYSLKSGNDSDDTEK